MPAFTRRSSIQLRWSWLLSLALLLPLAQSAALGHAYSHGLGEALRDQQGPHKTGAAVHCDLCLAAAAACDNVLAGESPRLATTPARFGPPQHVVHACWLPDVELAYESRAPPASLL
jgi:hypothetical protein